MPNATIVTESPVVTFPKRPAAYALSVAVVLHRPSCHPQMGGDVFGDTLGRLPSGAPPPPSVDPLSKSTLWRKCRPSGNDEQRREVGTQSCVRAVRDNLSGEARQGAVARSSLPAFDSAQAARRNTGGSRESGLG
jgi:hypothetical protein